VSFKITSPLQVIASGNPISGEKSHGTETGGSLGKPVLYEFEQPVPIPSYLFAIASGDLRSAKIGPRSTVWSGPGEIEGCKWELEEDMEKFLEAAESLIFQYQWGTYNVLVLPASFTYGGMYIDYEELTEGKFANIASRYGESNSYICYSDYH
jgi:leukotriene-A4 hydrolase